MRWHFWPRKDPPPDPIWPAKGPIRSMTDSDLRRLARTLAITEANGNAAYLPRLLNDITSDPHPTMARLRDLIGAERARIRAERES